jgi:hypothetical protein
VVKKMKKKKSKEWTFSAIFLKPNYSFL